MLNNPLTQKTKRIHHGAVEYVEDAPKPSQSTPPLPAKPKKTKESFGKKMAKKTVANTKAKLSKEELPDLGGLSMADLAEMAGSANGVPPDPFLAISDVFQESWVNSIELPKMMLRSTGQKAQTVKEKSTVLVHLENTKENIEQKMHSKVLSGAKKDSVRFDIYWLDPETVEDENPKVLSTWKLLGAKVVAVDFGSAEYERKETSLIAVEFEYDNINIDGTEI